MGCWNNTCALTNLPIINGEEVYVFPVRENDLSSYRSHCETSSLYSPAEIPFIADYNDYGAGENCRGIALTPTEQALKADLIEMEEGENQYHDIPAIREEFDIYKFFDLCHKNRMYVRSWESNRPAYFAMVRKDVVDAMWTDWELEVFMGKGKGNSECGYYYEGLTFAAMADELPAFLEDVIVANNKLQMYNFQMQTGSEFGQEKYHVERYFRRIDEHSGKWNLIRVSEAVQALINSDQKDKALELLETALVGMMIGKMMSSTRKIWLPAMHMGSQSEEYNAYRTLAKCSEDVIVNRLAEYED